MKKVCFSIPCYNEVDNVELLVEELVSIFNNYDYELSIEFIDNSSTDGTIEKLEKLCEKYGKTVKAIINARNFGGVSNYHGILQTEGDCTIVIPSDFQVPLDIIPELLKKWENGAHVVCAVKKMDSAKGSMKFARNTYYKIVSKYSRVKQIDHFTGAGLYDADFIKWLRAMNDPMPSLRGMVVEYGVGVETVYYEERKRRSGKSKQNLDSLLSVATKNLVNYSVVIPRMCEILAIVLMFSSFAAEIVLLVLKMAFGFNISVGIGTGFVILTFLIGVLIFVLGLLAEYLNILNQRMLNRPLVIEKERINFDKDNNK